MIFKRKRTERTTSEQPNTTGIQRDIDANVKPEIADKVPRNYPNSRIEYVTLMSTIATVSTGFAAAAIAWKILQAPFERLAAYATICTILLIVIVVGWMYAWFARIRPLFRSTQDQSAKKYTRVDGLCDALIALCMIIQGISYFATPVFLIVRRLCFLLFTIAWLVGGNFSIYFLEYKTRNR